MLFSITAFAQDVHLICSSTEGGLKSGVSIYKINDNLVFQMDAVIMVNNQYDKFGGYTKISTSPNFYRVEYQRNNFNEVIQISRVTGEMNEKTSSKRDGVQIYSYKCVATKQKF